MRFGSLLLVELCSQGAEPLFLSVRCLRDEICPEDVWALCLSAVLSSECRPHTELSKQSRELKAHQTEGLTGCEDTALFNVLLPFLSTLKQISRPPEPELCHGELFLLCAQQAVSLSLIPLVWHCVLYTAFVFVMLSHCQHKLLPLYTSSSCFTSRFRGNRLAGWLADMSLHLEVIGPPLGSTSVWHRPNSITVWTGLCQSARISWIVVFCAVLCCFVCSQEQTKIKKAVRT